ncbi:cation/H(+) antiporter 2-like [Phragmites australis]|uniref:cation/H(+) antiporter 2-like n=1 Tax=Phragmites australis TaxID=29695 RepID=UPI002D77E0AD|nr:cation/H(+) antiporter 2-like [Phragmites australis]
MARSIVDCGFNISVQNVALDTLFLIVIQAAVVIALGKFIHLSLRRHNQPSAISQILAGIIVGSLGLHEVIVHVDVENAEDTYGRYVSEVRIFYMFYVGLEADLAALWNDMRRCTIFTYASVATCLLLAAFVSGGMYGSMMHTPVRSPELLAAVLMLTLANTASVDISRMASEMGLAATASGRLVVVTAIGTNIICIVGEGVFSCMKLASSRTPGYSASERLGMGVLALLKVGIALSLLRPVVAFMNRRNAGRHRIGNWELLLLLVAVSFIGNFPQRAGFDGMPASLLLGLAFPREGPVARSVMDALAYPLHALALPFYFGAMGMRLNFSAMSGAIVVPAILLTLLGLIGKCLGTMGAARFLKMPLADALRFGVLLNVKGHVNMIDMSFASSEGVMHFPSLLLALTLRQDCFVRARTQIWAEQALMAMVVGSMISTIIAGPVLSVVFRKESEAYAWSQQALEHMAPDQELRMLACVHGARGTPGMLSLLELLASKPRAQPTIHVLHFYDVARKHSGPRHYHKRVQDSEHKHMDRRNDATTQVNWAVDVFTCATGLAIRQIDAGDRGPTVNAKAVRRWTEDVRASILLVPYRKEQHYDGSMVCRREDRSQLNLEVLARAPCTTGILADRPFRSGGTSFQLPTKISTSKEAAGNQGDEKVTTHVAAVFLGGPDDREAVALACRLAKNESVSLTVIRFVLRGTHDRVATTSTDIDGEVSVVVHDAAAGVVSLEVADPDEDCMSEFHRAYVAKERAAYAEKAVTGPLDVVEALRGMAGAYALVVAGRGGRQPAELVMGLEGWAECAEVGPVGEILASEESLEMGSVLVVQQKTAPPFHLDLPAPATM